MAVTQNRDTKGQLIQKWHSSVTNKDYSSEEEAKKAETEANKGSKLKNAFSQAGKNNANASETDINNAANNLKNTTVTPPSTGNMVDGWYSWIDPYNGKGQSNKLTKSEAEGLKKQFAEQYPGYNIQMSLHKNQGEAEKAAAGKKGEPAKPKKEIQVPPKKDDNGSGTSGTGTSAQPQTEELDKFFASLTYTDEKSFDEALNKIDNKIKELQAQIGSLPDQQSKDTVTATLNELMKRRDDYIAEAKKSTDSGIKDRAEQAGDATISPEEGNVRKQKVAEKFKNGEELTAEEWATLDANRTDIAAMIAESTGRDYKAIQDEINKKVYEEFKKNAQKGVDDLANSKSEIDPNNPEFKDSGTTNPPGTGKTGLTTGTGGKGDGGETDMDKFWKAFKAGAFRAYPMLQAIGDALSQQAKMTMDRANILTGKGSDLSVYEGKDPSEYFFNEDYEYRQAFLDAEAGNYEGVKELLLKGKVTLDQVAAALKLSEEDVEKIFGQEMRQREAGTVSQELANEKTLTDDINNLRAQVDAIDKDIHDLDGNDVNHYLEVLDKYMAIYEGKETLGSSKGTTTTKNDSSGGSLGGSAGNSAVGLNASINGGHQEGTTEASNASTNKDLSFIAALPKGEDFAKKSLEEKNKANDELIANLKEYKQFLENQIADKELELKTIRENQNAAQTGGKNKILIPSSKDMTTTPTTTNGGNENATEQPQQ